MIQKRSCNLVFENNHRQLFKATWKEEEIESSDRCLLGTTIVIDYFQVWYREAVQVRYPRNAYVPTTDVCADCSATLILCDRAETEVAITPGCLNDEH